MRVVVPRKTTYLHAEAVDRGPVDVPPRVLEEVRPTAPATSGDPSSPPSVVVTFTVDAGGRISNIEASRTDNEHLTALAIEAISRWKITPALRDGDPVPTVATLQLTFDPAPPD